MLWGLATGRGDPAPTRIPNPLTRSLPTAAAVKMFDSPAAADPLNPNRRVGLKAIPALTMFSARSGDLSVAPCRRSSKVIDCPFTLYFAPNPGPMPVPTYQWAPG